jgi:hypothetical protein
MSSTAIGLRFFNFDLEYLKSVQSSEPLHANIPLILLLHPQMSCMGTNRNLVGLQKCERVLANAFAVVCLQTVITAHE